MGDVAWLVVVPISLILKELNGVRSSMDHLVLCTDCTVSGVVIISLNHFSIRTSIVTVSEVEN